MRNSKTILIPVAAALAVLAVILFTRQSATFAPRAASLHKTPGIFFSELPLPEYTEDIPQADSAAETETEQTDAGETKKVYDLNTYGSIEEKQQEFFSAETGEMNYYYTLEEYFFSEAVPNASVLNQALRQIYAEYEAAYLETAQSVKSGSDDFLNTPFSLLKILSLSYVGEDYVSLRINNVSYYGGATPDSYCDGITLNCETGELVTPSQITGISDTELLQEISSAMGLSGAAGWDDLDFYLTDTEIVFFYRVPNFWEVVRLPRQA